MTYLVVFYVVNVIFWGDLCDYSMYKLLFFRNSLIKDKKWAFAVKTKTEYSKVDTTPFQWSGSHYHKHLPCLRKKVLNMRTHRKFKA